MILTWNTSSGITYNLEHSYCSQTYTTLTTNVTSPHTFTPTNCSKYRIKSNCGTVSNETTVYTNFPSFNFTITHVNSTTFNVSGPALPSGYVYEKIEVNTITNINSNTLNQNLTYPSGNAVVFTVKVFIAPSNCLTCNTFLIKEFSTPTNCNQICWKIDPEYLSNTPVTQNPSSTQFGYIPNVNNTNQQNPLNFLNTFLFHEIPFSGTNCLSALNNNNFLVLLWGQHYAKYSIFNINYTSPIYSVSVGYLFGSINVSPQFNEINQENYCFIFTNNPTNAPV